MSIELSKDNRERYSLFTIAYFLGLIWFDLIWNDNMIDLRFCTGKEITDSYRSDLLDEIVPQWKFELCLHSCVHEIYNYRVKNVTDSPLFYNNKEENDTIMIKLLPHDQNQFICIHQPRISLRDFMPPNKSTCLNQYNMDYNLLTQI